MALDLAALLKPGQEFRLHKADGLWAEPVLKGRYDGKPVDLTLDGAYAPEFAAYILTRNP